MEDKTLRRLPNLILHTLLPILLCAAMLSLAAGVCWGAPQAAGQALQRFTVLSATHLTGPSLAMTGAEANCVINGNGDDATMKCKPVGVTAKDIYHYYAALVVDTQGVAYIVACRNSLVTNLWCRPMGNTRTLHGTLANGHLLVSEGDGDKSHDYLVLASRTVGELTATQPAPPAKGRKGRAAQASAPAAPAASAPAASAAPAPASAGSRAAEAKPSGDGLVSCASSAGTCAAFTSDPPGADIYVDGKFVGNTPSTLTLTVGSHEIRMESAGRKTWTRTLDAGAGGRITIRGTLDALPPQ